MTSTDTNTGSKHPAPRNPAHTPQGNGAASPATEILLAVDDGKNGHYVIVSVPSFSALSASMQNALNVGFKYEALRAAQAVAKKEQGKVGSTRESVRSALLTWAQTYKPSEDADRVDTVESKRVEVCMDACRAKLAAAGKPTHDAQVLATMGVYLKKYASEANALWDAFLTKGYEPKRKDTSGAKSGTTAVSVSADDI